MVRMALGLLFSRCIRGRALRLERDRFTRNAASGTSPPAASSIPRALLLANAYAHSLSRRRIRCRFQLCRDLPLHLVSASLPDAPPRPERNAILLAFHSGTGRHDARRCLIGPSRRANDAEA